MQVLNIGRREEIIGSNTLEYIMEKTEDRSLISDLRTGSQTREFVLNVV